MNKKVFGRKLSRSRPAREALFATLARAMFLSGKIETTRAKAKAVQGDLERFVTLAKKGDLAAKRRILAGLDNSREAMDALIQRVAPSFSGRSSGYTRLISLPRRKGDNAQMMRIEWTEKIIEVPKEKKPKESASLRGKTQRAKVQIKSKKATTVKKTNTKK